MARRLLFLVLVQGALARAEDDALASLWPLPQSASASGETPLLLDPDTFSFKGAALNDSALLYRAAVRFQALLFPAPCPVSVRDGHGEPLASLRIDVTNASLTVPQLGTDESYRLIVESPQGSLAAATPFGALRGLERFSQLVLGCKIASSSVYIRDEPRFAWRGLMLDTSRHFLPMASLLEMVDAMEYNMLNVLHWHIMDTQSFPLLTTNPLTAALGESGAYGRPARYDFTYTIDDVKTLVAYAADRGVRIVPEVESPGHAYSWSFGRPELTIPECQTLDITKRATYEMLDALVGELAALFPDEYFHVGCDEVQFNCWNESSTVTAFMDEHGYTRVGTDEGFKNLTMDFILEITDIVARHGKVPVAWQEAFDKYGPGNNTAPTVPDSRLPPELVVQTWKAWDWGWANLTSITGGAGTRYVCDGCPEEPWSVGPFTTIATSWHEMYLDHGNDDDWQSVYAVEILTNKACTYGADDPAGGNCTCSDTKQACFDLRFDAAARKMVVGAEACLWGERIDAARLPLRAWPRASAVAERLWSALEVNNATAAEARLERHRCRMLARGVPATPWKVGACAPDGEWIPAPTDGSFGKGARRGGARRGGARRYSSAAAAATDCPPRA